MEAIYYLWGEESYLIDQKVQELIDQRQQETQGETEVLTLDTEELRPQEWAQELQFSPLFQLSRILVIKRPPWLAAGNKKVKDERIILDILEQYAAQPPQGQILILTAPGKNASNPIVKVLEPTAAFIECPKLTPKQVENWLVEQAKKQGCQFATPEIVRRLAGSGQDLYYLSQLIQKMALIAPEGVIKATLLENQVEYKQEVKIFKLIDGVLERKLPVALEALQQLLDQGEAEIYLLYMLNRQFLLYAQVKAFSEEGQTAAEIEKRTRQKSFTVKKMLERARKYRWDEIESGMGWLLQTDMDLKSSGKPPQLLLETLLIAMIEGLPTPIPKA